MIKHTILRIKKWIRRIKRLSKIQRILKLIIGILGPVMSMYLMADGFMNKDKETEA